MPMSFEKIADAWAIGVPDDKWGEVGLAAAILTAGLEVTEKGFTAFCRGEQAKHKMPKKVFFTEALPRTATEKITMKDPNKKEPKAQSIKQPIGSRYCSHTAITRNDQRD